jgi:hypothetical protein
MSYDRRGLTTLRDRLIGTMLHFVQPLPESKDQQAQVVSALEAAYQMGRRDEAINQQAQEVGA